ncbi:MAG: TetR/AcrR family transcriptional regulator [Bacteroidetes bacterium]|nr:TetR/AcrR family transcriptional regulator [Bacteroidota bacterium]
MDEKFEKIIIESAALFRKYGIRSLSMDDISRELGISKKTIYQYVANKAELIEKILEWFTNNNLCMRSEKNHEANAIDDLLSFSLIVQEESNESTPAILFDLQKYYPDVFKRFSVKKNELVFDHLKRNMLKGIEEGLYRTDLDVDLVSHLYVKKLTDSHDVDFLNTHQLSFSRVFEVMFDNHIRGISNEKGLAYFESKKVKKQL